MLAPRGPGAPGRRQLGVGQPGRTAVYDYRELRAGHRIAGPAIVEVPTTTVVIPGGTTATVDALGSLIIRPDTTAVTARSAS